MRIQASNSTPPLSDPFLALVKASEKADTSQELDPDDYSDILYWEKSAYLADFKNGRGILQTTRTEDSGALGYIVDEEGIIITEQHRKLM